MNNYRNVTLPLNHFPGTFITFSISRDGETVIRQELELPDGRVLPAHEIKQPSLNNRGDRQVVVTIHMNGRKFNQQWTRHRLVAAAWLGLDYTDKGLDVHHLNRNHQDNRAENLSVMTKKEHKELHRREDELAAAIQAELIVLPCGDITFEPMKEVA